MGYSDTLAKLRKERGYTQTDAAYYISGRSARAYTFKNISHWETGVSLPPIEQFLLLCELYRVRDIQETFRGSRTELQGFSQLNALGVSRAEEYIALLSQNPIFARGASESGADTRARGEVIARVGSDVQEGIESSSRLREDNQPEGGHAVPERLTERLTEHLPEQIPERRRFIRLYDIPAAAGLGSFLDSDAYEDFEVDKTVPMEADFAVRISGDSMTPRFVDRQIVFVKEQRALEIGDIGVFELDGDAYIKRLGRGELVSLNELYKPIVIRDYQSFHIFGKVVG